MRPWPAEPVSSTGTLQCGGQAMRVRQFSELRSSSLSLSAPPAARKRPACPPLAVAQGNLKATTGDKGVSIQHKGRQNRIKDQLLGRRDQICKSCQVLTSLKAAFPASMQFASCSPAQRLVESGSKDVDELLGQRDQICKSSRVLISFLAARQRGRQTGYSCCGEIGERWRSTSCTKAPGRELCSCLL